MSQLELIWGLEKHNNLLEKHSKDLNIIKNNLDLNKLSQRHNNIENKLIQLNDKLENNKKNLMEKESVLKNHMFTLKETENELYSGNIVDFHQLDFLSKQKDKLTLGIQEIENEIITIMESSEAINLEIKKMSNDIKTISKEIKVYNKESSNLSKELMGKIDFEEKSIEKLIKEIDLSLLNRYNTLRKNRTSGIVSIVNDVCSGCNMMVPSFLHEKLRAKKEIIFCESCGRILYYQENKE